MFISFADSLLSEWQKKRKYFVTSSKLCRHTHIGFALIQNLRSHQSRSTNIGKLRKSNLQIFIFAKAIHIDNIKTLSYEGDILNVVESF